MFARTNASRFGLLIIASALAACGSSSSPNGSASSKSSVSGDDGDAAADAGTNGGSSNGTSGGDDSGSVGTPATSGDDAGDSGMVSGDDGGLILPDAGAANDGSTTTDAAVDAGPASLVGTWVPASSGDLTAATFTSLTLQSNAIWYESGQAFDGTPSVGLYTQPTSIPVDSSYGDPPAGTSGPYLQLTDNSHGDGQWDYGAISESADGTTLTMTLFAMRQGMGLRWASPTTIHLLRNDAAIPPLGTWKPATSTDQTNAGFATVTLSGGGAWVETGRTDGDTDSQGMCSEPLSVPITDPDYGSPPAGMHGPYLQLAETGDNDGDWIYGFTESADGSTLTLSLYARSLGMGLRWANPAITINLVPSN